MTPGRLKAVVRGVEIRARLEARIHSKTFLRRDKPPDDMCEIFQRRYMKEYARAYKVFEQTQDGDWT